MPRIVPLHVQCEDWLYNFSENPTAGMDRPKNAVFLIVLRGGSAFLTKLSDPDDDWIIRQEWRMCIKQQVEKVAHGISSSVLTGTSDARSNASTCVDSRELSVTSREQAEYRFVW